MSRGIVRRPRADAGKLGAMTLTLGQRVKEARERRALGYNELDRAIGSSSGYVSRVESGDIRKVGSTKLSALAAALRVSTDWLIFGHGEMEPAEREETGARLRSRPGWREAVAEARRLHPRIEEKYWMGVGEIMGPSLPSRPSATFVADLARALRDADDTAVGGK